MRAGSAERAEQPPYPVGPGAGKRPGRGARMALTARMAWQAPGEIRLPFRSEEAIRRAQERRLRTMVSQAYRHVPYYRETMRRAGLGPEDFRSADDLARLPLLERDHLQRDPEYFVSASWPPSACVLMRSGGSTGAAVTVFRDPASFFADAVQRERQRSLVARLAGRRIRYREAFVGPPTGSTLRAIDTFRSNTLLPVGIRVQRRLFATLHSPQELLPEIDRYRPDVIAGHGSYLDALFLHVRDTGAGLRLPRVVRYGADAMSEEARRFILDDLGVQVLATYGAIETPMIGFECEEHRGHHLNVDLCPLRLLGPDGREAPPGEAGEVVVSNLVNRGTVLLNYRLGDIAAAVPGACPCGRNLPLLSIVEGKVSTWIDLGEGAIYHPQGVRSLVRAEAAVRRYQLVQEERRRFLLRLVAAPGCDREATARRLAGGFRESVGHGVEIRVEYLGDLPTGSDHEPIRGLPPAGPRAGAALSQDWQNRLR